MAQAKDESMTDRETQIRERADRFLAWPVPQSVRSDLCMTMDYKFPRRGTSIMDAKEAAQMVEYLCGDLLSELTRLRSELDSALAQVAVMRTELRAVLEIANSASIVPFGDLTFDAWERALHIAAMALSTPSRADALLAVVEEARAESARHKKFPAQRHAPQPYEFHCTCGVCQAMRQYDGESK